MTRRQNEKPSDLEQVCVCVFSSLISMSLSLLSLSQEAVEKASDLLATARAQMEEQDDELKKLNEAILNAKCHAIRDAQLREREEIERAMREEEVREEHPVISDGVNVTPSLV